MYTWSIDIKTASSYLEEPWTDVFIGDVENSNVKKRSAVIHYNVTVTHFALTNETQHLTKLLMHY